MRFISPAWICVRCHVWGQLEETRMNSNKTTQKDGKRGGSLCFLPREEVDLVQSVCTEDLGSVQWTFPHSQISADDVGCNHQST